MDEPISIPLLPAGPFHRAPPTVQTTLAVKPTPDEPARKVTKIISYRDGGFGLIAPYHDAKKGFVTKTMVDYSKTSQQVLFETTERFSASDRVKLSYHPDGFVQFSGENTGKIVSGRDAVTGEPKGLGFMTNPLNSPVTTGPSFGISFWGLDDFQVQKGTPRGDLITFKEHDFVYEHCDESTWGSYGISFFIFGIAFQQYVRKTGPKRFELDLWLNQFMRDGAAFNLKVARLGHQPWFLGAACFRRPWIASKDGPASGWIIGSPGARTKTPVKPVMHAHYPDAGLEIDRSLDYDQWTMPPVDGEEAEETGRFGRDYRSLFERVEAELKLRAPREVPILDSLQEGTAVLAEILNGVWLQPLEAAGPEGPVRAVIAILSALGLRAARAFNMLLAAGYVPEAASMVGRLQSVFRVASQVRDDQSGDVALRMMEGAELKDLDPEGWEAARGAMEIHLAQMPGLTTIATGSTVRPGLGFAGQREAPREAYLGTAALIALADIALIAYVILRAEDAPRPIKQRLYGFRRCHDDGAAARRRSGRLDGRVGVFLDAGRFA
jgi:hypothetical protein